MQHRAFLGLGSNSGCRRVQLDRAIEMLSAHPSIEVCRTSRYYETAPVGGPSGQATFLNAALELRSELAPQALLDFLQEIERKHGRTRDVRWGPRTLDLDLLLFDDVILDVPRLLVPHPRFAVRRFVLVPLAEIAPAVVDPLTGQTALSLLENLDRRPSVIAFDTRRPACLELYRRFVSSVDAIDAAVEPPPAIVGPMRDPVPGDPPAERTVEESVWQWCESALERIERVRSEVAANSQRWVATSLHMASIHRRSASPGTSSSSTMRRARLENAWPEGWSPTCIVSCTREASRLDGFESNRAVGQSFPPGVPRIELGGSNGVDALAEVLAACEASRVECQPTAA